MRFSQLFAPTYKEHPKDATLRSHQYLLRGGFIEQVGSGIYNFLPLGKRVLDKIKNIIKEEMDRVGCEEVMLGFITPAELWDKSGRLERYGKELLRFRDRKEVEFVLGPTFEEAVTLLVKNKIKSYKNLPLNLYQIHIKFRDEIRPRFGLMRAREFIMKDGYSFHSSYEDLAREFNRMEQTYSRIFTRLGVDFRAVFADSGAIGGSGSKEFMVLAESGEDELCICDTCTYAANKEAAIRKAKIPTTPPPQAIFSKFKTPNIDTIALLSDFFKIDPYYTLKCVVKKAIFKDGNSPLVFFFLRGCDSLNEVKAFNVVKNHKGEYPIELVDATITELERYHLPYGFMGPYGIKHIVKDALVYFDNETKEAKNLICGANEMDYHFVGVDLSQFENLHYCDLVEVQQGDICNECGGRLNITRGIEVGHIFKLGTKYSKALEATFLNKEGKAEPFIMGCYGIGVSRLVSAIVEQSSDEYGMIWTREVAPFDVHIIVSNVKDKEQLEYANSLYQSLMASGISVLLDDRDERYGVKIADFELMGNPYGLVIGRGLAEGRPFVEWIKRKNLEKVPLYLQDMDLLKTIKENLNVL